MTALASLLLSVVRGILCALLGKAYIKPGTYIPMKPKPPEGWGR